MELKNTIWLQLFLLLNLLILSNCQSTDRVDENLRIIEKLSGLEGVEFITESGDTLYRQSFKLMIEQPLDHNKPNGEKFMQKVYLSHLDLNRPVVFSINGYNVNNNRISELSNFINANQIYVEHRFFGESKPGNYDWNYLNIEQAAADHHRIIQLLKKIYKGKWVSTGISKGGQATIYHRYFYPEDVDA
ncbi:MAG: peptidase, partial [Bacteroidetes bacterium]